MTLESKLTEKDLDDLEKRYGIPACMSDPNWRFSSQIPDLIKLARKALKLEEALFEKQKLVESAIRLLESYSYEEFQERKL